MQVLVLLLLQVGACLSVPCKHSPFPPHLGRHARARALFCPFTQERYPSRAPFCLPASFSSPQPQSGLSLFPTALILPSVSPRRALTPSRSIRNLRLQPRLPSSSSSTIAILLSLRHPPPASNASRPPLESDFPQLSETPPLSCRVALQLLRCCCSRCRYSCSCLLGLGQAP